MESFLISFLTIGLAEFGDKSQLITLYLLAQHHRARHIIPGMAMASLLNHYVASWIGFALYDVLSPEVLKIISGALFILIGVFSWKYEDAQKLTVFQKKMPALFICFLFYFVAEAADKTQVATAALAAYYYSVWPVVFGASLGMVIANLPVLYLGKKFAKRISLPKLRKVTAVLFVGFGGFMLGNVLL